MTEPTMV